MYGYVLKSLRSGEKMCPGVEHPGATVVMNPSAALLLVSLDKVGPNKPGIVFWRAGLL